MRSTSTVNSSTLAAAAKRSSRLLSSKFSAARKESGGTLSCQCTPRGACGTAGERRSWSTSTASKCYPRSQNSQLTSTLPCSATMLLTLDPPSARGISTMRGREQLLGTREAALERRVPRGIELDELAAHRLGVEQELRQRITMAHAWSSIPGAMFAARSHVLRAGPSGLRSARYRCSTGRPGPQPPMHRAPTVPDPRTHDESCG